MGIFVECNANALSFNKSGFLYSIAWKSLVENYAYQKKEGYEKLGLLNPSFLFLKYIFRFCLMM